MSPEPVAYQQAGPGSGGVIATLSGGLYSVAGSLVATGTPQYKHWEWGFGIFVISINKLINVMH